MFDGDPLKFWTFYSYFENTVGKSQVGFTSKFTRLLQFCTGKFKRLIECCSAMEPEEGYRKALQLLKDRFGDGYTIAKAWMSKIRK